MRVLKGILPGLGFAAIALLWLHGGISFTTTRRADADRGEGQPWAR
jgi:hypothetical protein